MALTAQRRTLASLQIVLAQTQARVAVMPKGGFRASARLLCDLQAQQLAEIETQIEEVELLERNSNGKENAGM